ncbi:MAG: stalk domain-containing protein [Candidatus Pristimantibacillus sp.]
MQQLFLKITQSRMVLIILCLTILVPGGIAAAAGNTSNTSSSLHKPIRSDAVLKLGSNTAIVNGNPMTVQPVYEKNGITMGPVNVLIRTFKLDYKFDSLDKSFWLSTRIYEKNHLSFKLGQTSVALDNGVVSKPFELSAPPVEKKGSLMVPLRSIVERLGGKITYDAKTKEIRITGIDRAVTDPALRIGDSQMGWSIAAPNGFKPNSQVSCEGCYSVKGTAGDRNYSLVFSASESKKKLTLTQLQEQKIAALHPSEVVMEVRTAKQPAGEFSVVATSWNDAFGILYKEYWTIQVGERIYQIVINQDNDGNGRFVVERDRITLPFMSTFQTSFDANDPNQLDFFSK